MNRLKEIMEANRAFLDDRKYEEYRATKYPDKKMVVFSCMDTRLTHMLPEAMGLRNGDAKIIKNAGAVIMHPFGSVMRSIIVAIYELGAEEVFVVGHHGCGMANVDTQGIIQKMKRAGISEAVMDTLRHSGIDLNQWLHGFDCVELSVQESVGLIRNHPLIPDGVRIHGLVMSPDTGEIDVLIDGNESE